MKKNLKILKWVTGGIEAFLAIPVIGGSFIVSLLWIPLAVMLALHITILVFCKKENLPITGNILGIIASALGWVPIVGWILHILTAIFVMIEASKIEVVEE
ncbi:hypothetical protein [Clostridium chauvoei]|uniref:Uncharacterized protein n=2 Tax=Clostridium chauvoei TaxID=46867 RepID=S6FM02_9CLOT|nr:hypothetical protein [Clostridium chauvoei]ATD55001.1 hypothetical protein BTM20_07015 [Clostridium chauvoei]ATD57321.1 hypothetical protein BTM21_06040 [Clostridium chauvoei]MBX7281807.1 hypothetical protein [Clostridium chauvoei]MBX7284323.1 hypothetical protein [Clostridium chauvoei]MBX7286836.1 hypothetical protein [Clostridium chauvoei]